MTRRNRASGATIFELVQHASPAEVASGFGAVAAATPRLVAAGNRFDRRRPPKSTSQEVARDAPPFFAAASVLHLEDGYSYAGRSIGALLRGDRGAATHLAYYAELRATLSLLASHGILNVNTLVFSLGAGGDLRRAQPGGGTHALAWKLLDAWTARTEALDLLSTALRPFNVPLEEWLAAAGAPQLGASAQATAQHWLNIWSLDLKRMQADHHARNKFSYNPTRLVARPDFAGEPFVAQTWSILEPTPGNPFEIFDRHLLRMIVDKIVSTAVAQAGELAIGGGGSGSLATTASSALEAYIASARRFAGEGIWEGFLRREPPQDHDAGFATFCIKPDDNPWSLLSRALILLRVSAGAVRARMSTAGIIGDSGIEGWAKQVIAERNLASTSIEGLNDLWGEIETALDHLATCPPMTDQTQHMLRQLETSERVALWALAA